MGGIVYLPQEVGGSTWDGKTSCSRGSDCFGPNRSSPVFKLRCACQAGVLFPAPHFSMSRHFSRSEPGQTQDWRGDRSSLQGPRARSH